MPHWLIKSAIHRVISWLPQSQVWNGLLQTYVTRSTAMTPQTFEEKLEQCRRFLNFYRALRPGGEPFQVLELGTGWFPTVPVGLYLCGAGNIWTIDIDPLLSPDRLRAMLQFYCDYESSGVLKKFLPHYLPARMEKIRALLAGCEGKSATESLAHLNITVIVADAQRTPLPDASIDLFFSNGVLEYVPRPVLQGILKEFTRLSSADAVMVHRLNLVDQFSYFDRSITPFNFLKYTTDEWRWRNSPLIWQNRLRISDYRELLTSAGFEIAEEDNASGKAEDLAAVPLAPEFRHYSQADLLVLHSFITAKLPTGVRTPSLMRKPS